MCQEPKYARNKFTITIDALLHCYEIVFYKLLFALRFVSNFKNTT